LTLAEAGAVYQPVDGGSSPESIVNRQDVWRYFLAPSSRSTRLIVLALTPYRLANSINVDPPGYEVEMVRGSTSARSDGGGTPRPSVAEIDAPVVATGCSRALSSVLASAFVWFTWFE
jgi:hypothetical protein